LDLLAGFNKPVWVVYLRIESYFTMNIEILTKTENKAVQKGIISKIGDLITYMNMESGDKLPSERKDIYEAIKAQDPKLAKEKMKAHFKMLYQYCYSIEE
jgi:DNA-binding FadR family transcriptional regulator